MWAITAAPPPYWEEIGFPEELVVNSSLELAASYIPCLRQMITTGGSSND